MAGSVELAERSAECSAERSAERSVNAADYPKKHHQHTGTLPGTHLLKVTSLLRSSAFRFFIFILDQTKMMRTLRLRIKFYNVIILIINDH